MSLLRPTALVRSKKKRKKKSLEFRYLAYKSLFNPSSHWALISPAGQHSLTFRILVEYFTCYGRWNVTSSECSIVTVGDFLHFML